MVTDPQTPQGQMEKNVIMNDCKQRVQDQNDVLKEVEQQQANITEKEAASGFTLLVRDVSARTISYPKFQ